jgi:carbon monoxide dehydrogenase subunit G
VIEARADATLPTGREEVFAEVTRLENADWLPAVRRIRRLPGPASGLGARYEVEVGLLGRHLGGVLVCREWSSPARAVYALEQGMDLTITVNITELGRGCRLELVARYSVGGGLLGSGVERASSGPARREVARAVEAFAARFARAG